MTIPAPYQRVFQPYTGNPFTYGYGGEHLFFPDYNGGSLLAGFTPEPNPQPQGGSSGSGGTSAGVAAAAALPALGLANQASQLFTGQGLGSHIKDAAGWAGDKLGLTSGGAWATPASELAAQPANAVMGDAIAGGGWEGSFSPGTETLAPDLALGGDVLAGGMYGAAPSQAALDAIAAGTMADVAAGAGVGAGAASPALAAANWGAFNAVPAVGMAALAAFIGHDILTGGTPMRPEEHLMMSYDPVSGQTDWTSAAWSGGSEDSARAGLEEWRNLWSGENAPNFDFYDGQGNPLQITIARDLASGRYFPEVQGGGTAYAQNNGFNGLQYMGGINPQGRLEEYNSRASYDTQADAIAAINAWLKNPNQTDYSYMRLAQERQDSR